MAPVGCANSRSTCKFFAPLRLDVQRTKGLLAPSAVVLCAFLFAALSIGSAQAESVSSQTKDDISETTAKLRKALAAKRKASSKRPTRRRHTRPRPNRRRSAPPTPDVQPQPIAIVQAIRYMDGSDRVQIRIDLSASRAARLIPGVPPRVVIEGARLAPQIKPMIDVSQTSGPVRRVYATSASSRVSGLKKGPAVSLRLDLALHDAPHRLRRSGNTWVWEIAKAAAFSRATVGAQRSRLNPGSKEMFFAPSRVAGVASRKKSRRGKSRNYRGRRIDLDFKDADIHNILRLLSDVGDVNIITSDAVSGKVTLRMKNLPWDQALDVILRSKGLGQVREGNLVRVAPLADLEKEREAEIARKKQVMLLQPLETRLIPLSYATASEVLAKLKYTLSPRGKVTSDERTNTVIARDISENLNLLEQMIRNLDTQTPQVMIESRIVEARTNYSREFGVQWGGSFAASAATGNSTGLAFPNQIGIGGGTTDDQTPSSGLVLGQDASPNFAVNMPAATGLNSGGALGLTLGSVSGAFNVNLRLSAAETEGDIRIISAPKITTLDNVEARIEQGVSIPFSQVSAQGVQTQFRDAKLSLTVKPHVTADGSIVMQVKVERNEPDFINTGARGDPSILKKQAETEMLVKDGDTAVIGGIYTTRDGKSWQKVPWLAEIPILGWIFKKRRESSDREEVLVFITPRIINRDQSIGR